MGKYITFNLFSIFCLILISSCENVLPVEPIEGLTNKNIPKVSHTIVTQEGKVIVNSSFDFSLNTYDVPSHGFCWSKNPNPDLTDNVIDLGEKESRSTFTVTIEKLEPNTRYYVRSFVVFNSFSGIDQAILFSDQIDFETENYAIDPSGEIYPIVQLNGKNWLAKNMNINNSLSVCYDYLSRNCEQFGMLYKLEGARQACASLGENWRLATEQEWRDMVKLYGGADIDAADGGVSAYFGLIRGGNSGFNAVLGGYRDDGRDFYNVNSRGYYWTDTKDSIFTDNYNYYAFRFESFNNAITRRYYSKEDRLSCRCIQD